MDVCAGVVRLAGFGRGGAPGVARMSNVPRARAIALSGHVWTVSAGAVRLAGFGRGGAPGVARMSNVRDWLGQAPAASIGWFGSSASSFAGSGRRRNWRARAATALDRPSRSYRAVRRGRAPPARRMRRPRFARAAFPSRPSQGSRHRGSGRTAADRLAATVVAQLSDTTGPVRLESVGNSEQALAVAAGCQCVLVDISLPEAATARGMPRDPDRVAGGAVPSARLVTRGTVAHSTAARLRVIPPAGGG